MLGNSLDSFQRFVHFVEQTTMSLFLMLFSVILLKTKDEKKKFDPYDWDDPNNCSDREYMDNDDYDDFDH